MKPPSKSASQILAVQSLTSSHKLIQYTEFVDIDGDVICYYAVKIQPGYYLIHDTAHYTTITDWCTSVFPKEDNKSRWFVRKSHIFLFNSEEDRNWFVLRWS